MAFASVTYTSASGTTFALTNSDGNAIEYLRQSDISVTVNGTLQTLTTDYTFNAAGTSIVLNSAVSGATVILARTTSITDATVSFTAGSTLTAQDLNNSDKQNRFALQEFTDLYDDLRTGTGDLGDLGGFIDAAETWVSDAGHAATTDAIDARIAETVDLALTTDVVAGNAITITDDTPAAGQITVAVTDGAIDTAELTNNAVTTAKITDLNVTTGKIADSAVTTAKIDNSAVTTAKINDAAVTEVKIADSSVTNAKLGAGSVDTTKMSGATVVTNSEHSAATVNDTSFFTTSASDARYFRQDSTETIASGDTWTGSDAYVATTGAIDARIVDLVDDVGGFVPIANETSFPATNPDVNDGTGTIVSVAAIGTTRTPVGGTVTIANGSGSDTVTITGCGASDLEAGYGMLVETTTTLHTYTFHRLVPKATEVTTVAGIAADITTAATNVADINNFADLYQISGSDPTQRADTSALQEGDLVYRTDLDVIRAYNGTIYQNISPDAATLADIAIVADDLATFEDLGLITDPLVAASSGGALETCADNIADINTLADIEDGTTATDAISNLAAISSNVTTVATNIANVNTVAGGIADINRYASEYTISASQPSSPAEGDLWYDSTANELKYYNGATWASISAGISQVLDDTSPELGGNLDCNGNNLTEVGTIDGADLTVDFGTLV